MASVNLGKVGLLLRGDWDSDTDYAALDVVSHEGYAYAARVANKNVEPSAETAAYWQPLAESASVLATMLGYKNDAADSATAAAGSATAAATSASSATDALANEAADFSSSKAYAIGDYVIYNNGTHKYLYRFTAAHSAGAWIGTDATQVALADDVSDLKSAIAHNANWKSITWTDGKYIKRGGSTGDDANCSYAKINLSGISKIRFLLISTNSAASYCTKNSAGQTVTSGFVHTPTYEWVEHTVTSTETEIRITCDTALKGEFLFYYLSDYSTSRIATIENDIDAAEADIAKLDGEVYKNEHLGVSEWEDGKYTPNSGTDGTSKVNISINGSNANYLTCRTKQVIPDKVISLKSTGNYWFYIDVYDYDIAVDYSGFIGQFNGTEVVTNDRGQAVQYADLSAIKAAHPSYHFKLTACDSTLNDSTRPTTANVNNAITYKYSVIAQAASDNPCDYNGFSISTFNKILCIGDSFTAGTFNYYDASDQYAALIDPTYSYPTILTKMTGVETTNKGDGGKTCETWYNSHSSDDLSGHDCCVIALGINDAGKQDGGWNATSNTYLTNILTKIKSENNNIKIFISTIIPTTYYHNPVHVAASEAIRTFVANYNDPNVALLDLEEYGHTMDKNAYQCRHLTALGYNRLAKDIANYISYIMDTNSDVYRNVQFAGTNYTLGNW